MGQILNRILETYYHFFISKRSYTWETNLSRFSKNYYSELYNRVSKILLQNRDWTQNEWCPFCRDE
ncbi:hypothetical protein LEP1GSC059_0280 [Leptospira noguchii serovar Panama str. CZ214]|uniref:Uncharacterized protein n=1 Tax=Leptospira noguchii serovar Panama str. CZ214 TaxID=1001595 RepID=T0H1T1_9LEPT|nr:hypothetical protein LEP1GSC059_0280 [Leptospira noguchii serovar Panama str. CZ214]